MNLNDFISSSPTNGKHRIHFSGFKTIIASSFDIIEYKGTWYTVPVILEGEIICM